MLFIKLWLVGIIISVITGIMLYMELKKASCLIRGERYLKGEIRVGLKWIPIALSFALFGGMPNGFILMTIIKFLSQCDIVLTILVTIIIMAIMIIVTYYMEAFLMGLGIIIDYFEYYQEAICMAILITTTIVWTIVFFIL